MVLKSIPSWGRHQGISHNGCTGYGLDGPCNRVCGWCNALQSLVYLQLVGGGIQDPEMKLLVKGVGCSCWGNQAALEKEAGSLIKRCWLWNMLQPPWHHLLHHFLFIDPHMLVPVLRLSGSLGSHLCSHLHSFEWAIVPVGNSGKRFLHLVKNVATWRLHGAFAPCNFRHPENSFLSVFSDARGYHYEWMAAPRVGRCLLVHGIPCLFVAI